MAINSLPFLALIVAVFALYYIVPSLFGRSQSKRWGTYQNVVLLLASYFFYAYADLRMLPLLLVVTVAFYFIGIGIEKHEDHPLADRLLLLGVVLGVGMLVYFKYTNFFIQSFVDAFRLFGKELSVSTLSIILPVGISFYTFTALSYSIDVYQKKVDA
ncbi:MAG: MBOAT family protein, partial [Bacteroidales bacterium]|nr:MBOAT family protein [Bacteroidales bacterium]